MSEKKKNRFTDIIRQRRINNTPGHIGYYYGKIYEGIYNMADEWKRKQASYHISLIKECLDEFEKEASGNDRESDIRKILANVYPKLSELKTALESPNTFAVVAIAPAGGLEKCLNSIKEKHQRLDEIAQEMDENPD